MNLISREPTMEDFDSYYRNCFFADRDNLALRAVVAQEWRTFLRHPAALTLVVEDLDRKPALRLVSCAQCVFVTNRFAEWARSGAEPWVIRVAASRLPDGSPSLLSAEEVEEGCTESGGLNALVTRWGRGDNNMPVEYRRSVHDYRQRAFINLASGYRFRQILIECVGAPAARRAESAGFKFIADYADYYRANPSGRTNENRPYLLGITRDEAEDVEGSLVSHFFAYRPRQFEFAPMEQDVLDHALAGETDPAIAAAMGINLDAVKYRWRKIYAKVERCNPALWTLLGLDAKTDESRGKEKRRLLLIYLRGRPEELRRARR